MRERLLASILLFGAIGCGGSGTVADAGASSRDSGGTAADAAGADANTPACQRDSDCSDGLSRTGEERCRPGDASADTRGCVTLSVPCDPGACNEAEMRCESCPPDMRDMDGDSYVAEACGGHDCDDTRNDIHPGATEVCVYAAASTRTATQGTPRPGRRRPRWLSIHLLLRHPE